MKISKVIFKLTTTIALSIFVVFSAQANCPDISDIIRAFNKNGLPPKGWLLVSYTGKQIDKGFYFTKAIWNANSAHFESAEGNITCEYASNNKANPGFLIVETTYTLPAPQGKNWRHLATGAKTTICKPLENNISSCQF